MAITKELISLHFSSEVSFLDQLTQPTEHVLESLNFMPKDILQLMIAIEEIFTNICKYAYPNSIGSLWYVVRHCINNEERFIELTFMDEGVPFNPLLVPTPDTLQDAESRIEGGLGIHLLRGFDMEVAYTYENNKNILFIRKKENNGNQ